MQVLCLFVHVYMNTQVLVYIITHSASYLWKSLLPEEVMT